MIPWPLPGRWPGIFSIVEGRGVPLRSPAAGRGKPSPYILRRHVAGLSISVSAWFSAWFSTWLSTWLSGGCNVWFSVWTSLKPLLVGVYTGRQAGKDILGADHVHEMRPLQTVAHGAAHLGEHERHAPVAQLDVHIGQQVHGGDVQVAAGAQVDQQSRGSGWVAAMSRIMVCATPALRK